MAEYQLITDLCESRVFRSKQAVDKFSRTEKEDLLYAILLATIALSLDTKTSTWAREYASKTAAFSGFDYFRPSATDLYVLLHVAEQGGLLGMQKMNMVRILKGIGRGTVTKAQIQELLLRLERSLRSIDGRLRVARRTVISWDATSPASRLLAVQNLILVIQRITRRSEVLPYLKVLKGGPRGHFGKASSLKKAAALAGIGLAGFALGYKTYDPTKKFGRSRFRDSIEFDTGNMLVEDRPTQLAYLVQKLPDHPAVEKVVSVNYLADGIRALVRTTDGNAYEFVIRPARFAKEKEMNEEWEYKIQEVDNVDEPEEVQTQYLPHPSLDDNPPKLTRRQIKSQAQDELMHGIAYAFHRASDTAVPNKVIEEMDRQARRIEKLLGYEPGSWPRGI